MANSTQTCHVLGEREMPSTVTSLLLEEHRHTSCGGACVAFFGMKENRHCSSSAPVPLVLVTPHFGAATDYLPGWRQLGR
jgi:hypothetical protein